MRTQQNSRITLIALSKELLSVSNARANLAADIRSRLV